MEGASLEMVRASSLRDYHVPCQQFWSFLVSGRLCPVYLNALFILFIYLFVQPLPRPPSTGFDVTKSGDIRVGMVGFPSVGKSSLLTKITGTASEVAAYEFTTLTCIPGTINYRGSRIQLLDMPVRALPSKLWAAQSSYLSPSPPP